MTRHGGHRRVVLAAAIAVFVLTASAVSSATPTSTDVREGGFFRISLPGRAGLDNMDPALSFTPAGWALLDTVCARLMAYPDKRPPAGLRLQPEVAAAPPTVSSDLKTFTFTLRSGFRFSDGSPVRASAFARAINRTLAPSMKSPGALFTRHIVGAADVLARKRTTATGVVARGNTLIVRFTRPAPEFPALTALPFFCAVPPTLPDDAEGIGVFPTAGPYRVTEYRPGERVVIRRNPFYGGARLHHVDGFDVDLRAASPDEPIRLIERGEADWTTSLMPIFLNPALGLEAKYGVNRSRFFSQPGLTLRMLTFNTSRPLFRNNPALRKAVNFALDRQALQAISGGPLSGRPTDQYIPPLVHGFRDEAIYPLERADPERARELARGNLRGGKAVLYTNDAAPPLAVSQLAKQQLAQIGLEVEIRSVGVHSASAAYLDGLTRPGAEWDIALVVWTPNVPDAQVYLSLLLDSHQIGGTNVAAFKSAAYDRALQRAARTPQARERQLAYGSLDVQAARDSAPLAALSVLNEATFVSERVDGRCMVLRPGLVLTAVCLK
jgi:peptide/nickel transport system substrate-binding protein